ncbi:hypothetical protein ACGF5O_42300 [Streptomyces sp. NPDC048291]|uniref:hypothetical protein n=1 Tax=Streptomyces sp. NPDC048291 TaxID=3365530 RepID=UPI00371B56F6
MARLRLRSTPVGDALLIHPKGRFDDRAAAFAGGITEDPLHTLAVVDLPGGALATEWESVARLLSSARYGSPRLVFGRSGPDEVRTACRRIADRLGRDVLAPDGDLVPTVDGGLFVPGEDGAAWLRFRPGHDPEPVAQRFPKPHWEFSVPTRTTPVGASAVVQPVPAGVWLRPSDRDPLAAHHGRAVAAAPTDPHLCVVVLGSPGTPPLSPVDVARFWDTVLPGARPAVRFVLYGALDVPADHTVPGQALADVLGAPVVLYDTLPTAAPGDRTTPSTTTYLPTDTTPPAPATAAVPPVPPVPPIPPAPALPPVRTESGADPSTAPAGPDTEGATDLSEAPTVRNPTGPENENAAPVAEPAPGHGNGAADLDEAPTVRSRSRTVRGGARAGTPEAEATPMSASASASPSARVPGSASAATPPPSPPTSIGIPGSPETSTAAGTPAPPETSTPAGIPGSASQAALWSGPVPPAGSAPAPAAGSTPPSPARRTLPPESTPLAEPVTPDPVPPHAQRPLPPTPPRFRLESAAPEAEIAEIAEMGGLDEVHALGGLDASPERDDADVPAPPVGSGPAPGPVPGHGTGTAAVPSAVAGGSAVRVQPVPRAAACALPPERGVAQERDWLRRTFSEQYNALAGSVSRVMSESPGLRGRSRTEAADALTELVAVRLYLSGDPRLADAAVREAAPGPHVPLARCVTAGLRRLPSYRGPALLRTRLGDAERAWYREGRLATEWAFCHARTSLHPGPRGSGATDVLIWSMTARRTSSLDAAVPDRVVFLPGTAFRVLRAEGPAVLMRELSPSEAAQKSGGGRDEVAAKLDEIAVKGLEKILDALERAGTDAAAESADPPGLIVTPRAVRTEGVEP